MGLLKVLGIGKYLKKVKEYTDQQIANLVGSAPETLDTLQELSTALKDNANIVDTLNNAISKKADKTTVDNDVKNITNIINSMPIVKGDMPNSAVLDGEYEGYSNKAISQVSVAVGAATTAGLKGWYYTHVNVDEKKIYLSTSQYIFTVPIVGTKVGCISNNGGKVNSSFVSGYEVGDVISIVYDHKYENYAIIEAIDGNEITLDKVPFKSSDFNSLGINVDVNNISKIVVLPDDYSVYCIKRDFNDTLKTLTVTKYDNGGVDFGGGSLSEGVQTYAINIGAHAEGGQTMAKGQYSHAEGLRTQANYAAHAEGVYTEAIGRNSHAEGNRAKSIGDDSHAEGDRTESHGAQSHAEGASTKSFGDNAHSEGESTIAIGNASHSEGRYTVANVTGAHAEGRYSIANDYGAHAEGGQDSNANAELKLTSVSGNDKQYTYSSGNPHMYNACYVNLNNSHVIAQITAIDTTNKIITLDKTIGNLSNVIVRFAGYAGGVCSHSEGSWSVAVKNSAHAEGYATYANALASHAEGHTTTASGDGSHAEGRNTIASNQGSHAEGDTTKATKHGAHAEGRLTESTGDSSHSEGYKTKATGAASHAEGWGTITNNTFEHASGQFNKSTKSSNRAEATLFSIGMGTSDSDDGRKNAFEVKQNGDIYIAGLAGVLQDYLAGSIAGVIPLPPVKIQTFGDSITDNHWGDNSSWVSFISDNISSESLTVINSAVAGAALGLRRETDILSQVTSGCSRSDGSDAPPLDTEADIVVVFGGTNDYSTGYSIEDASNNLAEIFEFISSHSRAKVLFCTPMQRYNAADQGFNTNAEGVPINPLGKTLREYCEELIRVCVRFSVPVCDLNAESNINRFNLNIYSSDGLHPNIDGDAYLSKIICKKIKELAETL